MGAMQRLLRKGQAFRVKKWVTDSTVEEAHADGVKPDEVTDLTEANVISSLVKGSVADPAEEGKVDWDRVLGVKAVGGKHNLLLDIDRPAELVESSTPGHYHLYVELLGGEGIDWEDYVAFLHAAAKIGLIESGYAYASQARGYTALRLPWVSKHEQPAKPVPTPWGEPEPF